MLRLAVEQDLALVRLGQPEQDVHQRGLARAVLAEQRVDLARLHGEVDVVVGHEAAVALRDPLEFQPHPTTLLAAAASGGSDLDPRDPGRVPARVTRSQNYSAGYTGLLVGVLMLPFSIPAFTLASSDWSEAGTLPAKSWYGASVTPPLARVPM